MWGGGRAFLANATQKNEVLSPKLFPSPSLSSPLVDVSIEDHHYALLTADGSVYTGGRGQYGELGWQGKSEHGEKRVEGLPPCVSVRCGLYHTVALTRGGEVYVWGWGGSLFSPNALGIGRKSTCTTPTLVTALQSTPIQQIAAGKEHCLALSRTGELYAWGKGEFGRLGLGGSGNQLSPQRLDELTGTGMEVASIAAGSSFNGAVLRSGALYTWGRNEQGQLGLGGGLILDQYSLESVPQRVEFDFETAGSHEEDITVEQCATGYRHMLARTRTGQVYVWGMRTWIKPAKVRGDDDSFTRCRVVDLAAGKHCNAAVDEDGNVWTWGSNVSGCLGHGERKHKNVKEPRRVQGFGKGQEYGRAVKVISGMEKMTVLTQA